jgi:rfaE bifunctional protein nucleotidyltransferase chain/domain
MTTGSTSHKIVDREAAVRWVQGLQAKGRRVVFTNGCFDLLHVGHVLYLEKARSLGDALIVGVNTDDSAARLDKGPGRPLNPEADRARVLAALGCVDRVVLFAEDTPLELITILQPDVLVKGGDYQLHQIVGREVVEARGGQVLALPFLPGYSTTALIERIRGK